MAAFPRTVVDGLSVSRMIIGTNWILGFSHQTPAKDQEILNKVYNRKAIADILEVFFRAGVDTIMGPLERFDVLLEGIDEAEQRTGTACIKVSTPVFNVAETEQGLREAAGVFDQCAKIGAKICMPHHSCVERLLDKNTAEIRRIDQYTKMIRQRGMIPGLSAHVPEAVNYTDKHQYDVATYIQLYNAVGFLMQLEVEFIYRNIQQAKKPVMTIKPMAAGRLTPFVGLTFVWNTIRPQDMVTVGTMSADEAREVIDISLAAIEHRPVQLGKRATPSRGTIIS